MDSVFNAKTQRTQGEYQSEINHKEVYVIQWREVTKVNPLPVEWHRVKVKA
jgi:hypothetical protein